MLHSVNFKPLVVSAILVLCPLAALASPGYYVQGEAGLVEATTDVTPPDPYFAVGDIIGMIFLGPIPNWNIGDGGRVSAGYLWGNNNVNYGVESGITYFAIKNSGDEQTTYGSTTSTGNNQTRYDGVNVDLLGVLKYTFNCGISVFSKAGGVYTYQHADNNYNITTNGVMVENVQVTSSGEKIYPEVAVGMGYQFNPHFETDLTLTKAFGSDYHSPYDSDPVNPPSSLFLGVTYHF
jgi:hypothetical protein